jgi:hypothetical protein
MTTRSPVSFRLPREVAKPVGDGAGPGGLGLRATDVLQNGAREEGVPIDGGVDSAVGGGGAVGVGAGHAGFPPVLGGDDESEVCAACVVSGAAVELAQLSTDLLRGVRGERVGE